MTEQLESIPNNKYFFRWNFAEDDWLIDILLNDKVIRHQLFIVKNYNLYKINDCIYELLNKIQKYSLCLLTRWIFLLYNGIR